MTARRLGPTTAVLAAAAVVAAGAGGALPAAAKAPTTRRAEVASDYYAPGTLKLRLGDRVRWTWHASGLELHDVTVDSGPATFGSPTQASGTYTHRFTKAGTYRLYCTQHEDMTQTVVVARR